MKKFLVLFPLVLVGVNAKADSVELFCMTLERVGNYDHVVRINYNYDEKTEKCEATAKHSYYTTSYEPKLSCLKPQGFEKSKENKIEIWNFENDKPEEGELLSVSVLKANTNDKVVGLVRWNKDTTFSVRCNVEKK